MRSIVELLGELRSKNITLALDGDALKCSAPPGILTAELRAELGTRKLDIIVFLRSSQAAARGREQGIPKIARGGPLPLSFAQQRLWFLNQLEPDSPAYNIGIVLRIEGQLDVAACKRAFATIVERHEDLRTSFTQVEGVPSTIIGEARDWSVQVTDARHLSDGGPESELLQFAAASIRKPFDITRGSQFRAELFITGPGKHLLVLTMHHIISDGWSFGVVVQEFTELYQAYAADREPALAALSIQYADFAAWQRSWLESGELDRQLPYWKKQLAGAPPVLGFPADHPRPAADFSHGSRSKLVLSQSLARELEQLSQRQGVTLFMTLLAAFDVLLARYTGQDDIVVGSPSANRSRAELNPLIGFFVNNLVLRTDLSGNPTFTELLERVREMTLRAYEHQDVPFDMLVHALRPERSLDHSPLFQVMFILQNFPLEELDLAGLVTTPVELDVEYARFDLTVEVFLKRGELHVYFDYNSDLYEAETMARIAHHYLTILTAVVGDADQVIGSIPLLSAAERDKLLLDWKGIDAALPEELFHERIAKQAQATPGRVAVLAGEESLTYFELEQRARRIAECLTMRGAGPEKLVAICLPRSANLLAALLGVAKSGAAYIPLDPAYPRARIVNIFADARPQVILTSRDLLATLPHAGVETICVDELDFSEGVGEPPAEDTKACRDLKSARSSAASENLAYVIFTSGSTGRPKGVEITHRALVNFLESMQREPGFRPEDVLLAVTTVSFDIAALELLLPLYSGGTVCIALHPGDPAALLSDIERYRPTVMQATPATWKLLVAAGWKGDSGLKILCGGEALDPALARSLLIRSESLWNMYGPTEITIWSSVLRVDEAGAASVPLGRPIQNTAFYVLDAGGQPVPMGVAGELWIGGTGVARGYLNRPELTRERFVASPFVQAESRLYRTGDLVRYRSDGTLEFFGRLDHQVKFRGFRIELGEIENALRSVAGVLDAVMLLREDDGVKRLVGYIVCAAAELPLAAMLQDELRVILPDYMVPGAFVYLKELPRLPNGKLDRAALPAPERAAGASRTEFTAPATEMQRAVAEVFRNILSVDQLSVDDNFFDLGAHSLQIVRAHAELNHRIDPKIALVSFFQYPTIRSLARFIEQCGAKQACTDAR